MASNDITTISNMSNDNDESLAVLATVAESDAVAPPPVDTTAESSVGVSTTMVVDNIPSPPPEDNSTPNATVPAESAAVTQEAMPMSETMTENTITSPAEEKVAEEEDVVGTTAITTNDNDLDDAMMESEENAISMASTALLIDLERRYVDMSTENNRLKMELNTANTKMQQYQQQLQEPIEMRALQNSLNAKDEQIKQLQNQMQTQQESYRLVQDQKNQLQANSDTLQEEIR